MLNHPKCYRCQSSFRLVAYRHNDGNPIWVCSTHAGSGLDTYRNFEAQHEVENLLAPRQPSVLRRERPEPLESLSKMKPKYTGPRAKHDPMRF